MRLADPRRLTMPYTLRYVWQGMVRAGSQILFRATADAGFPEPQPGRATCREQLAGGIAASTWPPA